MKHMLLKCILGAYSLLLCTACSSKQSDFFPYHNDGTPKPKVAIVPMYTNPVHAPKWNMANDVTFQVRNRLMREGQLFVPTQNSIMAMSKDMAADQLFSPKEIDIYNSFRPMQYVVVMELMDFQVVPYQRGAIKPIYPASVSSDEAKVARINVRFQVVDLRHDEPQLLRSELIENAVSKALQLYGTEEFSSSEMGIIEARLARDIVRKIEKICCKNLK